MDTVCSFSPQCGPKGPVSVPRCGANAFCYIDWPRRPRYGLRSRAWLTSWDFEDPGTVYTIIPPTEPVDQSVIQGMFMLSRLWAKILFDSSASHSFVAASNVDVLGLEVETLEEPLDVSSPRRTRVRINQICWDCELEIPGILIMVDLRVIDI